MIIEPCRVLPKGQVLTVPSLLVRELARRETCVHKPAEGFTVFVPETEFVCDVTNSILNASLRLNFQSIRREWAEKERAYMQLLPYVVIRKGDKILAYKRGKEGSEARLVDKRSIGFGGHIDSEIDYKSLGDAIFNLDDIIQSNIQRELKEELGMLCINPLKLEFHGLLVSDSPDPMEVGHFHVGLLHTYHLEEDTTFTLEEGVIEKMEWVTLEEAAKLNLEPWSATALHII